MELEYIGDELSLFEKAKNWKSYWGNFVAPYLKGDVLEVGAGLGGTTMALSSYPSKSWTCLEPDPALTYQLEQKKIKRELPASAEIITGTLQDLKPSAGFDCILYIDVIEHIEDDKTELVHASHFLNPGGYLFVLVPAHQWLYSPFDKAIGHYRRYNKSMLKAAGPKNLQLQYVKYLDSVGLLASTVNKLFLQQSMPTASQIQLWDSSMVPVSRWTDKIVLHRIGKTVIGLWKKIE